MTKISKFFKELTEENPNAHKLMIPEMEKYIAQFDKTLSVENCEFVTNLCLFMINMLESSNKIVLKEQ